VLAWVQATQPDAWTTLQKNHGAAAGETLLTRLRAQLDQRGTLDVLRTASSCSGSRAGSTVAQFRPALAFRGESLARYAANRLRVVRQVRYLMHDERSSTSCCS
jgi:type I restriction enzyme R subunit